MARIRLVISVLMVAGAVALLVWQHSTNAQLRRDNESLRQAVTELKQPQEVHETASDDSATKEQLAELLKLRGEVTQLRGQTNEMAALHQQNEALKASIKAIPVSAPQDQPIERKKKLPEDAMPQDIHPKASWGYRGYSSPEATVESMIWAMSQGDKTMFMAGVSPEQQARFEKELEGKDFSTETKSLNLTEFRVLDRQTVSDDEMILTVYSTRQKDNGDVDSHSEDTHFKKIGGEWKMFER